ncbi:aldehyde dehydrogenase (NADP(+)) [Brevibacterium album]|uniref:aldehyde dehydrogenase (NADP(+)) n=1 Tax=Brevibacterium album TaxID=417948 RepID=UPI000421A579|nr:aldehyde dehydrogenase (NADP(+)) [Brevibacterium album]
MALTGHSIIAGETVLGSDGSTRAVNPSTNGELEPAYSFVGAAEVEQAARAAEEAFAQYRDIDPERRAAFLDAAAERIEAVRGELVERAMQETGLPEARLVGETARTTGQLRMFASVIRQGDFHGVRIDPAQPERTSAPRVDLRQRKVPLGPVAVFGASNFPLAFSVAGGDTASALAAGCPVIVKAHNAHPGTSELVGRAVTEAAAATGMPAGVFSLLYGPGAEVGQALVRDPRITAVGFTGSRSGGLALVEAANARPVPIPVYAEMSSINPVFVLPGALAGDIETLAQGFLGSVTGSSGQLCTSPGLLLVPTGEAGDRLVEAIARVFAGSTGQTMLTPGIHRAWQAGVAALASRPEARKVAEGTAGAGENAPAPVVFETTAEAFSADEVFSREIFGAASLIVRYDDAARLPELASGMEGQLTATLHLADTDHEAVRALLPVLERLAGRILAGGWPTGVEVGHAVIHGGPFPATSNSATTSVGSLAIERFLRPVSYQSLPEALLPAPVRDDNAYALNRRIDGTMHMEGAAQSGAPAEGGAR